MSPMSVDTASDDAVRTLDRGVEAWMAKPALGQHIAARVFRRLAGHPRTIVVVDHSAGRKTVKGGSLLAVALALSRVIEAKVPHQRVGIVLPPSAGGAIANLAVSLAHKTPVNLNFTLGRDAFRSCLQRAEIETVITAAAVRQRIAERQPDLPWPDHSLDISDEIAALPKAWLMARLLAIHTLPLALLERLFRVPRRGGDAEAAVLFSSGSDGIPKGVVLTHRNIIANGLQVMASGVLPEGESVLANLPIFHSFGFSITLWCALAEGVPVVYVPNALDFKKTAEVIASERCEILLGTPTFLRPYLKRVPAACLQSLKRVVAGAEKTPDGFAAAWETRFPHCRYLEGYGLTETSPVVAVNLPDQPQAADAEARTGTRARSVGRLFPGMAARILELDSGKAVALNQRGLLSLRGPNVFPGYLGDMEKTRQVLRDGWLITGDLARIDGDGFLYIEGRLSRFSKIAGEMVPHGSVENLIAEVLGQSEAEQPVVAVTARVDAQKGEALVLLTCMDIVMPDVRRKLTENGVANLWIPRIVKKVPAIPVLASGKLDLEKLKALAETDPAE